MTPAGLQKALIDLGWISLIQRVLDGRPAESFALRQLMRCPGRLVTFGEFADAYQERGRGETYSAKPRLHGETSREAVRVRIQRLRRHLHDLGVSFAAIRNERGQGYVLDARYAGQIERALLESCGIELEDAGRMATTTPQAGDSQ